MFFTHNAIKNIENHTLLYKNYCFVVKPSKVVLEYDDESSTLRCISPLSIPPATLTLNSSEIKINYSELKISPPISTITKKTASKSEIVWEGISKEDASKIWCEANHILLKDNLVARDLQKPVKLAIKVARSKFCLLYWSFKELWKIFKMVLQLLFVI